MDAPHPLWVRHLSPAGLAPFCGCLRRSAPAGAWWRSSDLTGLHGRPWSARRRCPRVAIWPTPRRDPGALESSTPWPKYSPEYAAIAGRGRKTWRTAGHRPASGPSGPWGMPGEGGIAPPASPLRRPGPCPSGGRPRDFWEADALEHTTAPRTLTARGRTGSAGTPFAAPGGPARLVTRNACGRATCAAIDSRRLWRRAAPGQIGGGHRRHTWGLEPAPYRRKNQGDPHTAASATLMPYSYLPPLQAVRLRAWERAPAYYAAAVVRRCAWGRRTTPGGLPFPIRPVAPGKAGSPAFLPPASSRAALETALGPAPGARPAPLGTCVTPPSRCLGEGSFAAISRRATRDRHRHRPPCREGVSRTSIRRLLPPSETS